MSAIPWILVSIAGAILVLGAVVVWMLKKGKYRNEPDYRAFFWMGLVWVIIGGPVIWLIGEFSMSGLFAIGVIFLAMGLANRDKWGKEGKLTKQEAKRKVIAVIAAVLVLLAGIITFELMLLA